MRELILGGIALALLLVFVLIRSAKEGGESEEADARSLAGEEGPSFLPLYPKPHEGGR